MTNAIEDFDDFDESTHQAKPGALGLKRAVIYLRVSDPTQVNTDYDAEGISLPAQRKACMRKAEQLGLTVVDEYVEPGKSAREMTKRVAFQQMLARIRRDHDVDSVIVYKLSRMARNRLDDAIVAADLKKRGVTLVSATEAIDETPVGQLMHGILAAFNEFRSAEEGADIAYKMGEKAKKGGTLGLAPIGYLNTIDRYEGREIRTVVIDTERAPLIHLAFELYATGEYTLQDVVDELTDRGLVTRGTPKRPAKPLSVNTLYKLLQDPYYIGTIVYKGTHYAGRHEPLVEEPLFAKVQEQLRARGRTGGRERIHTHYLRGTLYCGECRRRRGITQRLVFQRTLGRKDNEYFYYFCPNKECGQPFHNVDRLERAILDHYGKVQLSTDFIDTFRALLVDALNDQDDAQALLERELASQLKELDAKEENLLDLATDGTLPQAKIKARLLHIQRERERIEAQLSEVKVDLTAGMTFIEANLELLRRPQALYRQTDDEGRRRLNQAIFAHLFVETDEITDSELVAPLPALRATEAAYRLADQGYAQDEADAAFNAAFAQATKNREKPTPGTRRETKEGWAALIAVQPSGLVLNKAVMVGLTGFEPATP